jgi:hypothetical protein
VNEATEEQGTEGIPALIEGLKGALNEEVAESILDACLRISCYMDVREKL